MSIDQSINLDMKKGKTQGEMLGMKPVMTKYSDRESFKGKELLCHVANHPDNQRFNRTRTTSYPINRWMLVNGLGSLTFLFKRSKTASKMCRHAALPRTELKQLLDRELRDIDVREYKDSRFSSTRRVVLKGKVGRVVKPAVHVRDC
jgi:hypothetical protein